MRELSENACVSRVLHDTISICVHEKPRPIALYMCDYSMLLNLKPYHTASRQPLDNYSTSTIISLRQSFVLSSACSQDFVYSADSE